MSDIQQATVSNQVKIAVKVASLSTWVLASALRFALDRLNKSHPGQISMNKLIKSGSELNKIDVQDVNLKELSQIAKKYKISFAAVEDQTLGGYTLFFKANNASQLEACLQAYMRKTMEVEKNGVRQPFKERVEKAKAQAEQRNNATEDKARSHKRTYKKKAPNMGDRSR